MIAQHFVRLWIEDGQMYRPVIRRWLRMEAWALICRWPHEVDARLN